MSYSETQSFAQFKHKQVGGLWYLLSTTLDAYMSQMLYAGQSARQIVTFLSDF